MESVEIRIDGKVPQNAIILEGFQGVGLVGTLAAQYVADKTNAKLIGYINSTLLPPMALLINGELRHPMRVYHFKSKNKDYMIFESELPLPKALVHEMAAKIAEFAEKSGHRCKRTSFWMAHWQKTFLAYLCRIGNNLMERANDVR